MVAQRNKHDYDSLAINQPIKFLQVGNLRGYFVKTYNDRRKDMVNFFSFAIALCLSFGCFSIDAYGYNYILVQKDEERQVYLDKDSVKCSKGLCSYTTKIEFTEAGKSSAVRRGLRPETNYLLINDAVMCSDSPFISHLISMECVSENNFKLIYNPYAANFETIPIVNEHDLNGTIYRLVCFR